MPVIFVPGIMGTRVEFSPSSNESSVERWDPDDELVSVEWLKLHTKDMRELLRSTATVLEAGVHIPITGGVGTP